MRQAIVKLREQRDRGQHPGLILASFLAEQNDEGRDKRALFAAACAAGRDQSLIALYRRAFVRWREGLNGTKAEADLRTPAHTRLIVGLGNKGVIEAGLRLHHTYGVPLIPGSALKGLAAHYCHEVYGAADEQYHRGKDYYNLLFGSTDDGGVIRFEDAWIYPDSLPGQGLLADVMTPHHQKWQTDENVAPTDFDSPIPVPFLSVAGSFHVAVCWQGPEHGQAHAWTKRAMELLQAALAEWGVGGKTSSGYGRLVPTNATPVTTREPPTSAIAQRTKIATLPKTWDSVEAKIVADPKGQGRQFARHEESGLIGPIQKPEDIPEQERQLDTTLKLIVAMISTDGKQIQFLYPTAANQQRAQQAKQPPSRGKPPGKRGMR